jgi:hypothetical protein
MTDQPKHLPEPAGLSSEQWLVDLHQAAMGEIAGRPMLPAGYIVKPEWTIAIDAEIARLKSKLACPPGNEVEQALEITRTFYAFRQEADDRADVDADMQLEGYYEALDGIPAWAVGDARRKILRGDADRSIRADLNLRYPPTPPQLALQCRAVLAPIRLELARLQRIREAIANLEEVEVKSLKVRSGLDQLAASFTREKAPPRELDRAVNYAALEARLIEKGMDPKLLEGIPDAPDAWGKLSLPGALPLTEAEKT